MAQTISFPELEPAAVSTEAQDTRILPRNIFASGTLPGNTVIRVGENNITIDGLNRIITIGDNLTIDGVEERIILSDGTNDRVIIGKAVGGF